VDRASIGVALTGHGNRIRIDVRRSRRNRSTMTARVAKARYLRHQFRLMVVAVTFTLPLTVMLRFPITWIVMFVSFVSLIKVPLW
jgi:hypothetical protein